MERRLPTSVLCVVFAHLPTREFYAVRRVARQWLGAAQLPAATPPLISIPTNAAGWRIESLKTLRPCEVRLAPMLPPSHLWLLADISSIRTLSIRLDELVSTLAPLQRLPLLTRLALTMRTHHMFCICQLRYTAIVWLSAHIDGVDEHEWRPRQRRGPHRGRGLLCPSHLPTQLEALEGNAILSTARHTHEVVWPRSLRTLGIRGCDLGTDIPDTVTALTLRSFPRGTLGAILALPRLGKLDLSGNGMVELADIYMVQPRMRALESLRLRTDLSDTTLEMFLYLLDPAALCSLDIADNARVANVPSLAAFTRLHTLRLPGFLAGGTLQHATAGGALTSLDMGRMAPDDPAHGAFHFPPAAHTLRSIRLPAVSFDIGWASLGASQFAQVRSSMLGALGVMAAALATLPALETIDMSDMRLYCRADEVQPIVRGAFGDRLMSMAADAMPAHTPLYRESDPKTKQQHLLRQVTAHAKRASPPRLRDYRSISSCMFVSLLLVFFLLRVCA